MPASDSEAVDPAVELRVGEHGLDHRLAFSAEPSTELAVENRCRRPPASPDFDFSTCRVAPMEAQPTCPLPDDSTLAAVAVALNCARHWGEIVDREWRCVYLTDDARLSYGGLVELVPYPIGAYCYGP